MKVAYFRAALHLGGTEVSLYDILNNHEAAPYSMICIYREDGAMSEKFHSTNIKMIKLTAKKGLDIKFLRNLRQVLKKEKVDIVHAQHTLESCYTWLATLGTSIKIVQTFHTFDKNQTKKGKLFFQWMIRRADMNLFVSKHQMNYFINKYPILKKKLNKVVYNGIDFSKITTTSNEESFREPNKILLGSVGNFAIGRDQITICKFLLLLKEKNIPFKFLFIGKINKEAPEFYEECYSFCEKNNLLHDVLFLGSRPDVPNILSQLDAFIYSTIHDTFGIAVVEAISSGIPVFVNDWEIMLEITDNGKLATIYKSKDEHDLYEKFLYFLENRQQAKIQAEQNAVSIQNKFDIVQHIRHLYEQYLLVK